MIEICYIDNDKETIELDEQSIYYPLGFDRECNHYIIPGIKEFLIIPKDVVKSIRHIEV